MRHDCLLSSLKPLFIETKDKTGDSGLETEYPCRNIFLVFFATKKKLAVYKEKLTFKTPTFLFMPKKLI